MVHNHAIFLYIVQLMFFFFPLKYEVFHVNIVPATTHAILKTLFIEYTLLFIQCYKKIHPFICSAINQKPVYFHQCDDLC